MTPLELTSSKAIDTESKVTERLSSQSKRQKLNNDKAVSKINSSKVLMLLQLW